METDKRIEVLSVIVTISKKKNGLFSIDVVNIDCSTLIHKIEVPGKSRRSIGVKAKIPLKENTQQ